MKLRMYSIHDTASKTFLPPDFLREDEEAIRKFKYNVNEPKNGHLFHTPEHFSVHFVGYFDDETALMEPRAPECIITGAQAKSLKDDVNQLRMAGT